MTIKITSDSTCDLSAELLEKYSIDTIPLTVILGDSIRKDGVNVTPDDIYTFVEKTGTLPHTSAVSIGEYEEVFRRWREQGYEVVHFNIGSNFSASWQNACKAAEEVGGVYPVDTGTLCSGQGMIVLHAAEMAQAGASAEQIIRSCKELAPRIDGSFVLNTTKYLEKGGRCSKLTSFSAELLNIKPCIELRDDQLIPGQKYHGKLSSVIHKYVEDRFKGQKNVDTKRAIVTHTRIDPAIVEDVKAELRSNIPGVEEILEEIAGSTITTHCGPACLGIFFVSDPD